MTAHLISLIFQIKDVYQIALMDGYRVVQFALKDNFVIPLVVVVQQKMIKHYAILVHLL
jgi:hypothetical protein